MESQVFDVRKLDKSGRIGVPEALRALLGWRPGDLITMALAGHDQVLIERRPGEPEQTAPEDTAPLR